MVLKKMIVLFFILLVPIVLAVSSTPQKDFNLRDVFNITGANNISSLNFCLNGDCITEWRNGTSTGSDNTTWNESKADSKYVPYSGANQEVNLNNQSLTNVNYYTGNQSIISDILDVKSYTEIVPADLSAYLGHSYIILVTDKSNEITTFAPALFTSATIKSDTGNLDGMNLVSLLGITDSGDNNQILGQYGSYISTDSNSNVTQMFGTYIKRTLSDSAIIGKYAGLYIDSQPDPNVTEDYAIYTNTELPILFNGNLTAPNICYANGTNCTVTNTDNSSWNQTYADTLYLPIGTATGQNETKYFNKTTDTYNGSLTSGALTGYGAGDALCNVEFVGTHFCTQDEVMRSIHLLNITAYSDWIGEVWVSSGAAKYSPASLPCNDCNGWTWGTSGSYLGNWWHFDSTNSKGGDGRTGHCGNSLSLACCK